ncbi:MAG: hypothetical protein IJY52_02685 [Anaerotignum sp.]|nr:hypothetical protein [Anaerotignum sp.]
MERYSCGEHPKVTHAYSRTDTCQDEPESAGKRITIFHKFLLYKYEYNVNSITFFDWKKHTKLKKILFLTGFLQIHRYFLFG